jgi:hypothetical protein
MHVDITTLSLIHAFKILWYNTCQKYFCNHVPCTRQYCSITENWKLKCKNQNKNDDDNSCVFYNMDVFISLASICKGNKRLIFVCLLSKNDQCTFDCSKNQYEWPPDQLVFLPPQN